jgi:predicted O-methyltransferase YrrM
MFHDIPKPVAERMEFLERMDRRDRTDGTARMKRLRRVTPDVGGFIALLAAGTPDGRFIEIGTSAGYSALWLALACRHAGKRLTRNQGGQSRHLRPGVALNRDEDILDT